ncbi:MAG: AAA family ATPase, partial [Planctomycetota bacterium]|nr:AAA family ATPase [Planctomycetota bacterium]
MRITDISVDGFGCWNGLKLDSLSDSLTVFFGANEAGKSTLLQFLRGMLYGASSRGGRNYIPPLNGGRPGG